MVRRDKDLRYHKTLGIHLFLQANNNINTNKKQRITFPWIPKIGPKIKKEIQKFGFRVAFQTGPHLKNILCKNKDKLIPNSYPGVYKLKCSCGSVYNGETKKKIISRSRDKKASKVTGHPMEQPNTQRNATAIPTGNTPKLHSLHHKVLNRDNGNFVKTNGWKPLFRKMKILH